MSPVDAFFAVTPASSTLEPRESDATVHATLLQLVADAPPSTSSSAMITFTNQGAQPSRCVFCENCGSIVDEPKFSGDDVDCRMCGTRIPFATFDALVLRSATQEQVVESEAAAAGAIPQQQKARATVQEACPRCKHPELSYYTMQLRSADEGQTVFYECVKCGHAFSTNT